VNLFQPPEAEATSGKTLMAESCTQGDPDDCLLNGKVQHAVESLHKTAESWSGAPSMSRA
jgi:hypothetical protein